MTSMIKSAKVTRGFTPVVGITQAIMKNAVPQMKPRARNQRGFGTFASLALNRGLGSHLAIAINMMTAVIADKYRTGGTGYGARKKYPKITVPTSRAPKSTNMRPPTQGSRRFSG